MNHEKTWFIKSDAAQQDKAFLLNLFRNKRDVCPLDTTQNGYHVSYLEKYTHYFTSNSSGASKTVGWRWLKDKNFNASSSSWINLY